MGKDSNWQIKGTDPRVTHVGSCANPRSRKEEGGKYFESLLKGESMAICTWVQSIGKASHGD